MKRDTIIALVAVAVFAYLIWKANQSAALTAGAGSGGANF